MGKFWPGVGGEIRMMYQQSGFNLAPISLAVLPFDATPSGPDGDYLYTGAGDVVPTESGILATFAALGALWAPYYDPSWSLSLIAVYQRDGDLLRKLPAVPTAAPIAGTYSGAVDPINTFKRTLHLWGQRSMVAKWDIFLRWLQSDRFDASLPVTTTSGGFDDRDPAWYAYLSSPATGVIARDGTRYQPGGEVRQWVDTPLEPTVPYVLNG